MLAIWLKPGSRGGVRSFVEARSLPGAIQPGFVELTRRDVFLRRLELLGVHVRRRVGGDVSIGMAGVVGWLVDGV